MTALSLSQMSVILEAETGSGVAVRDFIKTEVGDCKKPCALGSIVDGARDAYGKADACLRGRNCVKKEEPGPCNTACFCCRGWCC